MKIHLVFYVSLLEIVLLGALLAPVIEIDLVNLNAEYKVEELLDY